MNLSKTQVENQVKEQLIRSKRNYSTIAFSRPNRMNFITMICIKRNSRYEYINLVEYEYMKGKDVPLLEKYGLHKVKPSEFVFPETPTEDPYKIRELTEKESEFLANAHSINHYIYEA